MLCFWAENNVFPEKRDAAGKMILLKFYVNMIQLMCANNHMQPDCWPWNFPECIDDFPEHIL